MKIRFLILVFLVAFINLNAQNEDSKKTNFTVSAEYKESILSTKTNHRQISREIFLGYRMFNSIVLEIGTVDYNEINKKTDDLEHLNCYGIGLRYQYLFKDNPLRNGFVVEPYIKFNTVAMFDDIDFYTFYDIGLNLVDAKAPFYNVGTGIRHNLTYTNEIAWYISFGVRF